MGYSADWLAVLAEPEGEGAGPRPTQDRRGPGEEKTSITDEDVDSRKMRTLLNQIRRSVFDIESKEGEVRLK